MDVGLGRRGAPNVFAPVALFKQKLDGGPP
jgi:hypothetical protein